MGREFACQHVGVQVGAFVAEALGRRRGGDAEPILPTYLRVLENLYMIKGLNQPSIDSLQRCIAQAHRLQVIADNPSHEVNTGA